MTLLVDRRYQHTVKRDLAGIVLFIGVIWLVFAIDLVLPLERFGLIPRSASGLIGIVAMPFLHGDFGHLLSNSMPLAVTLLLMAGSRANTFAIVFLIALGGGLALWLFGRTALHIGASGLVFGLIAFHIFAGIFERRLQSVLIALVVGTLYASTLFQGVLPFQPGVSWDGHLTGALSGMAVAALMSRVLKDEATSSQSSRQ